MYNPELLPTTHEPGFNFPVECGFTFAKRSKILHFSKGAVADDAVKTFGALRQFISFCLVGLVNTAVGLSVIFFLKGVLGASDVLANLVGYGVGISVSFLLNKRFTFSHEGVLVVTALKFAAVTLIAYCANLATVMWSIRAGVDSYIAQALGNVPYAAIGFIGSRYFVFRRVLN